MFQRRKVDKDDRRDRHDKKDQDDRRDRRDKDGGKSLENDHVEIRPKSSKHRSSDQVGFTVNY